MPYKHFTLDEFTCSETGENEISHAFVADLDKLRSACGFPFIVTSGYRSEQHSDEVKKDAPGYHTKGIAADIFVENSHRRFVIIKKAMAMGFTGLGNGKNFVHLDMRVNLPKSWTY
jgi:zinc D-Ala-D-Ala carboxypeptidase